MKNIIKVNSRFIFTPEHLETNLSFFENHKKVAPSLFDNSEFKTLKIKQKNNQSYQIVDANLINRLSSGTKQTVRASGLNLSKEDLNRDIVEVGVRLDKLPIVVETTLDGRYNIIDGVTKDLIYDQIGIKNRIVMVISIDEKEKQTYGNRLNAGELWITAGGLTSEADLEKLIKDMIDNDLFDDGISQDSIRNEIEKALGNSTKFSNQKRDMISWRMYHHYQELKGGENPVVFDNASAVSVWLNDNMYVDTDEIVYVPYASSSPKKAISALALTAEQNPNKEIRLVVYVSKFDSYDLVEKYISSCEHFKQDFYDVLTNIGQQYFDSPTISKNSRIKLYGFIPAGLSGICPDMDKIIKPNKLMTLNSYQNGKLSNALNIDNEDEYGEAA